MTGQAPAETLTLTAKPQTLVYGGKVTLAELSNQKVGEHVDALATPCGQTAATKVTTVQTTTGGAYTAVLAPLKNTVYTVKVKNTSSQAVTVKVRPRLRLGKVAAHRYSLRVFAAQSSPASTARSSATTAPSAAGSTSSACSTRELNGGSPDSDHSRLVPLNDPGAIESPRDPPAAPGRQLLPAR